MQNPFGPYSWGEFFPMVWRRFTGPSPRPASLDRDLRFRDTAPTQTIGFVGDICPLFGREAQFGDGVRDFLAGCDVVVGNFEGIFSDRAWWPFLMKHAPDVFPALAELCPLDRWVVSVANNHATDYGPEDLRRTLQILEDRGLRWVGTTDRPRLQIGNGVTVTAWTWWLNRGGDGVARRNPGAPSAPGLHIALPHWGYEHERQPRPEQTPPDGYTLTTGHHTHLPQPFAVQDNGQLVAYSLGNFVTGKQLPVLGEGAMLKVDLTHEDETVPEIVRAEFRALTLDRNRHRCRVTLHHSTPPSPQHISLNDES
ncbi:CapA family protein [Salinibacter altiplanensis]|uniref:CapA family protein n=1 Tax=Salinibacter altiplanensis TaxID=1803181 RepID=UPI001F1C64DF|nr:CapA family protein [Salinibacter altiplanensis]